MRLVDRYQFIIEVIFRVRVWKKSLMESGYWVFKDLRSFLNLVNLPISENPNPNAYIKP